MHLTGVIGLGQLGEAVACYLADHGVEVLAADADIQRVDGLKDRVHSARCLDATDEAALRAAGFGECNTVVLALGETQLEQSVLTTMALREIGVGRIISRAASSVQARVLERLGVSDIIFPERDVGHQLARQIMLPGVVQFSTLAEGVAFAEVETPPGLVGKTIAEAEVRKRWSVSIVLVKHRRDSALDDGGISTTWRVDRTPGPDTKLHEDDHVVVVGADESIRAFVGA